MTELTRYDAMCRAIDDALHEFRLQRRRVKPSLGELQTACRAAMQVTEDFERL